MAAQRLAFCVWLKVIHFFKLLFEANNSQQNKDSSNPKPTDTSSEITLVWKAMDTEQKKNWLKNVILLRLRRYARTPEYLNELSLEQKICFLIPLTQNTLDSLPPSVTLINEIQQGLTREFSETLGPDVVSVSNCPKGDRLEKWNNSYNPIFTVTIIG